MQLCMVLSLLILLSLLFDSISEQSFVRIALAIDDNSLKDALLLVNSIVQTSYYPQLLQFHVLACGKDPLSANQLKSQVVSLFGHYFNDISLLIEPFYLPHDSGFYHQLSSSKKRKHHWNSPIGADMARFYLPSVFPNVEKLLYLDNDIVVSCCVEEVYHTPLNDSELIGIALDDLQWATVTQFQRHYNSSHPLTIKYMRKSSSQVAVPISNEEFLDAVPKYPNDGVILFNVKHYNDAEILKNMDEIAFVNSLQNEHVINLGTQQFTVLALHDRWKELSTRSNLRHFPSMARGFLMWYYFHGILHYAGMFKAKALCQFSSYKDHNWLRVQSYLPWLINNFHMMQKSQYNASLFPSSLDQSGYTAKPFNDNIFASNATPSLYHDNCFQHVLPPYDFNHFLIILKSLANSTKPEESSSSLVVHIGRFRTSLDTETAEMFASIEKGFPSIQEEVNMASGFGVPVFKKWESEIVRKSYLSELFAQYGPSLPNKLLHLVYFFALCGSKWNFHAFADVSNVYANNPIKLVMKKMSTVELQKSIVNMSMPSEAETDAQKNLFGQFYDTSIKYSRYQIKIPIKKKKQSPNRKRDFEINFEPLCYKEFPDDKTCLQRHQGLMFNNSVSYVDILQYVKTRKFKHWDVVGLVVDKDSVLDTMYVLNGLDMSYLRPKFIVVHIRDSSSSSLQFGISHVKRFLNRNGFNHASHFQNFTIGNTLEFDGWIWGTRVSLLEFM